MSLSSVYDSVLRISFAAPGRVDQVPVPTPGGAAPSELTAKVLVAINLVAWAGTAAGVVGVLVCGVTMAISHRRGEGSEHMGRLGLVLGGCVLVATAGPIVQWFM